MRPALLISLLAIVTLGLIVFFVVLPGNDPDPLGPPALGSGADPAVVGANEETLTPDPDRAEADLASADGRSVVAGGNPALAASGAAQLQPGALDLRLLDGDGNPVPDAEVTVHYDGDFSTGWNMNFAFDQEQDENTLTAQATSSGRVLLSGVEAGHDMRLEVQGDYWAQREFKVAALLAGEKRALGDVLLLPGTLLSGKVSDAQGKGIAGAEVDLADTRSDNGFGFRMMGPGMALGGRKATTDDGGYYRMGGVRPSSYSLTSRATGMVENKSTFEVTDGVSDQEHNVHLDSGGFVTGVVRDESGTPLPSAKVVLVPAQGFAAYQWNRKRILEDGAPVADDGSFRLTGLPPQGKWRVAAAAPDFARGRSDNATPGGRVEVELSSAVNFSGIVLDAAGRPVPEASIQLAAQPPSRRGGFQGASTDRDGRFSIADLSAGSYGIEVTSAAGSLSIDPQPFAVGMEPIEVKLPAGKELVVAVVDINGSPLDDVLVTMEGQAGDGQGRQMGSPGRRIRVSSSGDIQSLGGGGTLRTRSDAQGLARFIGLADGQWSATLSKSGYATIQRKIDRNQQDAQTENIVLPPPATLRLTVADPTETPVSGAGVELSLLDGENEFQSVSRETDAWGLVVFRGLPPGTYRATEVASEGGFSQVMIFSGLNEDPPEEEPAASVDAEIEAGALIEETLILAAKSLPRVQVLRNGLPVADAQVRIEETGGISFGPSFAGFGDGPSIATDAQGWATLPPCKPGSYLVSARARADNPETELKAELHSGAQELRIELATGTISGTVVGDTGPLGGARVTLSPASEDGESGGQQHMIMSLAFSSDGEDGGGEVQTLDWGPGRTSATCDGDGRFLFEGVPPGSYELQIKGKGHTDYTSPGFSHDGFAQVDRGILKLSAGASLKGRISGIPSNGNDDQPSFQLLRLEQVDGDAEQMTMVQGDGSYHFRDLPPGTYQIRFDLGEEDKVSPEILVQAGAPTTYNWTL